MQHIHKNHPSKKNTEIKDVSQDGNVSTRNVLPDVLLEHNASADQFWEDIRLHSVEVKRTFLCSHGTF